MPTLNWIGKDKVVNHHQDVPYRILEPQYTFADGKKTKDGKSENKIIHGDNLEALKSLLPEYEGKVDCIYIDPPYNTGNENWMYNDNVSHPKLKKWLGKVVGKASEDLSRHDKWLCMMYPRLKLLHKLLARDGAIFISIDDNENASLKLICNEIFGDSNFVDCIAWQKVYTIKNSAKYFSGMHEYILVYAKSKANWNLNLLPRTSKSDDSYSNPDNDSRGLWTTNAIQARNYYDAGHYPIISPDGIEHFPPKGTSWRVSEKTFLELENDNRVWWGLDGKSVPRIKKFLKEAKQGIVPSTFWTHKEGGQNAEAKTSLREILNGVDEALFNTPKPVKLIDRILRLATNKNSVILDSFAGSGTTGHAVLNLNKEDNGDRNFILVEMEDYADKVTAERIKRVMNGYGDEKKINKGTKGNFTFYQLGKSIFLENEILNEEVALSKIQEYVWYSETKTPFSPKKETYLLGEHSSTAYYFYYEKDQITTLDERFLRKLKTKAGQYIIYADNCLLDKKLMDKYHIIFKKIPRDISRF